MAEPISVPRQRKAEHKEIDTLSEATVKYWTADQVLEIHNGNPLGDGEEIAQFVTVFYGRENENEVVAVRLDFAESVLEPFVDAILAKYGISLDDVTPNKQARATTNAEATKAD